MRKIVKCGTEESNQVGSCELRRKAASQLDSLLKAAKSPSGAQRRSWRVIPSSENDLYSSRLRPPLDALAGSLSSTVVSDG